MLRLRQYKEADVYKNKNGLCIEKDNFYPWIAFDESGAVGHFIMRYLNGDNRTLRFGWVIVDGNIRGKGYGTEIVKKDPWNVVEMEILREEYLSAN